MYKRQVRDHLVKRGKGKAWRSLAVSAYLYGRHHLERLSEWWNYMIENLWKDESDLRLEKLGHLVYATLRASVIHWPCLHKYVVPPLGAFGVAVVRALSGLRSKDFRVEDQALLLPIMASRILK